jgi:hypothetical protein
MAWSRALRPGEPPSFSGFSLIFPLLGETALAVQEILSVVS